MLRSLRRESFLFLHW